MSGKQLIVTLLFLALGVVIGFGSSLLFLPRNTTSVSTTQGQQSFTSLLFQITAEMVGMPSSL